MNKLIRINIVIFVLAIGLTHTASGQNSGKNSILFMAIDDWVEVYVDDKMVFKKIASSGQIENDVEFDLNPYIQQNVNPVVEIRLINAVCALCEAGNGWIIEFEVFQDGESVDYIIEEGDSLGGDTVFSIIYDWGFI